MMLRTALPWLVVAIVISSCARGAGSPSGLTTAGVSDETTGQILVTAPDAGGPWPVVVMLHGVGGDPHELDRLATTVAEQGNVVFNMAWNPTGDLSDVDCGYRYAESIAPRYGGDPDHVAAVGYSAGATVALLGATSDPTHPARIYGELLPLLADDAVIIGDGGDFVSWAGKFVEPGRPGCWLDPGPYGCLGAGAGAAAAARIARPSSQVVLLYGDGAAGLSLMDVDTLVRHGLPVVMIVGNNGGWGLEKHPMRFLYGYDVAADLRADTGYDAIVRALGGAGETVAKPDEIGAALRRAFDSGVPYLVNVVCDPEIAYPRSTTGV